MFRNIGLSAKMMMGFGILFVITTVLGIAAWMGLKGIDAGTAMERNGTECLSTLDKCATLRREFALRGFTKSKDEEKNAAEKWWDAYNALNSRLQGLKSDSAGDIRYSSLANSAIEKSQAYKTAFEKQAQARKARDEAFDAWRQVGKKVTQEVERLLTTTIEPAIAAAVESRKQDEVVRWSGIGGRLNIDVVQRFLLLRVNAVYLLATNQEDQWVAYQAQLQKTKEGLESWTKLIQGESRLEAVAKAIQGNLQQYEEAGEQYHSGLLAGRNADAEMVSAAAGIVDIVNQLRTSLRDGAKLIAARTNSVIAGMAVGAAVLGILLPMLITQSILRPLKKTFKGLKRCSSKELDETSQTFRRIIKGMTESVSLVNDAAAHISTTSQQFAHGASEQASSLEEASAALEELAAVTRTNAGNAQEASGIASQANTAAKDGEGTMVAINESSDQISKIIEVIEEIAFQTNLLALNAAVEAARAGEHGKGFAVVADEVRNLAQRAAQAARETTGLIENSVTKAKQGSTAIKTLVENVTKVTSLVNGINTASQEQTQGVDQINTAVSQIDKVTQQNAASAEESAAAAEQLSAQAETTQAMADQLVALVEGTSSLKRSTSKPTGAKTAESEARPAAGIKVLGKPTPGPTKHMAATAQLNDAAARESGSPSDAQALQDF